MRRRLLDFCLLAYPRARRERDYLRDLALDLSETYGLGRQARSLLRGGLNERIERRRRTRGRARSAWRRVAAGGLVLAIVAFAASGLGGIATSLGKRVEVERFACVAGGCEEARGLVAARVRAGWDCVKQERRRRTIAWGCTLGRAPVARAAGTGGAGRTDESIDRFLHRILPAGASGSLAAGGHGNRLYCKGFGMADRERRIRAGCDTVYDVMSMTKQFTAAAILKLQMMGKLDVTDPIGTYIGPVPADKGGITVQLLLTHTSGLIDALGDDYERLSRRDMVAGALDSKLQSPPGEEYHYSNLGYSLLAAIIEKASGMGYEEFLAEQLFAPAGMTQTGYVLPRWKRSEVAVEYDPRGKRKGRPFDHPWADDGPYWNLRGNGGMLSTARDMLRWHRALEGDSVLDQRSKDELFKPRAEEPGGDSYYGYGWVIRETDLGTVAWHNGGNGWSYGEIALLLDEPAMVFWVTNRYKTERWNLSRSGLKITRGVVERVRKGG